LNNSVVLFDVFDWCPISEDSMTSWLMAQEKHVLGVGSVILIYLLTTRRVPGYLISYPVGYPGNELPDKPVGDMVRSLAGEKVSTVTPKDT